MRRNGTVIEGFREMLVFRLWKLKSQGIPLLLLLLPQDLPHEGLHAMVPAHEPPLAALGAATHLLPPAARLAHLAPELQKVSMHFFQLWSTKIPWTLII